MYYITHIYRQSRYRRTVSVMSGYTIDSINTYNTCIITLSPPSSRGGSATWNSKSSAATAPSFGNIDTAQDSVFQNLFPLIPC